MATVPCINGDIPLESKIASGEVGGGVSGTFTPTEKDCSYGWTSSLPHLPQNSAPSRRLQAWISSLDGVGVSGQRRRTHSRRRRRCWWRSPSSCGPRTACTLRRCSARSTPRSRTRCTWAESRCTQPCTLQCTCTTQCVTPCTLQRTRTTQCVTPCTLQRTCTTQCVTPCTL